MGIVVLALLLVVASFSVNEPLRARMERSLNAELQGYTVQLRALAFSPLGFSITLKDLTISQNAHPQPPVARFPELRASVYWQALLRGRLLADFVVRQPYLRIDRTQLRQEVASDIALKDEGWQRALQAIYPLKINDFRIENGELTYIDDDPNRPLHISQLNLVADNIRNVHSAERVYPSNVHVEAVIFESGKLLVDGQANFLAVPWAAINADIALEQVQLDYFKPMLARINLWITGGALWANGHVEYAPQAQSFHLRNLTLRDVELDYVHSERTAAEEKTRATEVGRLAAQISREPLQLFRVDELYIANSTVGYVDHSEKPGYRVFMEKSDLVIKNLSNQEADGPASLEIKGAFMGSGTAALQAISTPGTPHRDLDVWVTIEKTQLRSLNSLLRTVGDFDVVAGELTLYSQIAIKKGDISGYVKPIFMDTQVYSRQQDAEKPWLHRVYERLIGGTETVLQNGAGEVATTVEISGRASDPETSTWRLAMGLIKNAFIKAVAHGFEPAS